MAGTYEAFYKLSTDPFRLTPDWRFSFDHSSYSKARAYMQYALNRGEGVLLVTGAPGTGKTTLIDDVLSRVDQANISVVCLLSTRLRPDEMLHMVAMSLGVSCADVNRSALIFDIEKALIRQHQLQRRVILMVDEAQNLSCHVLKELCLLSGMQHGNRLLLQVVLVGQQPLVRLVKRLELEDFRQRIIGAVHLKPLSLEDTVTFMFHRLMRAGWRNDPVITSDALESIYNFSAGVPRLINKICSRLLFFGAIEEKHTLDRDAAEVVIQGMRQEMSFGDVYANGQARETCNSSSPGLTVSRHAEPTSISFALPQQRIEPLNPDATLPECVDVIQEGSKPPPNSQGLRLKAVAHPVASLAIPDGKKMNEINTIDLSHKVRRIAFKSTSAPDPVSAVLDEPVYMYAGEAGQDSVPALEERRKSAVCAGNSRAGPMPNRHAGFLVVSLLALILIGYKPGLTDYFSVWKSPSQRFETVDLPAETKIQPGTLISERSNGTQRDQARGEMLPGTARAPVPAPNSPASGPDTLDVSVGNQSHFPSPTLGSLENESATGRELEIPLMALETTDAANRTANAVAQMDELAMLEHGPTNASSGASEAEFRNLNSHSDAQEVQAGLMSGHWHVSGKPAALLPSALSRCYRHDDHITCWSTPQPVTSGSRDLIYQVQSTIDGPSSQGVFRIHYRIMKSVRSTNGQERGNAMRVKFEAAGTATKSETICRATDSGLIRCRGAVDAVFRLGWGSVEQKTTCKAMASDLIRCRGEMEGLFRPGWKVTGNEMVCRAIDSTLVACRAAAGAVLNYRKND